MGIHIIYMIKYIEFYGYYDSISKRKMRDTFVNGILKCL